MLLIFVIYVFDRPASPPSMCSAGRYAPINEGMDTLYYCACLLVLFVKKAGCRSVLCWPALGPGTF